MRAESDSVFDVLIQTPTWTTNCFRHQLWYQFGYQPARPKGLITPVIAHIIYGNIGQYMLDVGLMLTKSTLYRHHPLQNRASQYLPGAPPLAERCHRHC